jgi:hypothetical protein
MSQEKLTPEQSSRWEESRNVLLAMLARYPYRDETESEYLTDAIQLFYGVLETDETWLRKKIGVNDETLEEIKSKRENTNNKRLYYYTPTTNTNLHKRILPLITHLMTPLNSEEFVIGEHIIQDIIRLELELNIQAEFEEDKTYEKALQNCKNIVSEEFDTLIPKKVPVTTAQVCMSCLHTTTNLS